MLRTLREFLTSFASIRPLAPGLNSAVFVAAAFLYVGSSAAQAQTCIPTGGTEQVLVASNHAMVYRANEPSNSTATSVLVQFGSSMRYLANSSDPGIGVTWADETFDPNSWPTRTYGVGYDTGAAPNALSLISTSVPPGTLSVYTRATFTITDVTEVNSMFFGRDYDDGYVAYLNGIEVARSATMPAGIPDWNTNAAPHESSNAADPNYGTPIDLSSSIPLLHNGTNVLAVGVWNSGGSASTDLVLVPKLSIGIDITGGLDWTQKDYVIDPNVWATGAYGVGYDTGTPSAAGLFNTPQVPAGTFSIYTRAEFTIADPNQVSKMFIGADYDDGYVAYINGVEVFGSPEMPLGRLSWHSNAALHESSNGSVPSYGTLHNISARAIPALESGTNVLAVGVWNSSALTSTDLALVPRLSIGEADPCDNIDNDCDGVKDEGYPNTDGGATADCVDTDDDNDGILDEFDCAPLDALNSAPPPLEVRDFQWQRSDVRTHVLVWQDQGFGVEYNLASGLASELGPDNGVDSATCVDGTLTAPYYDDLRPDPAPGDCYYYIIRAAKPPTCGTGSYGLASGGDEREPTETCPVP